MSEDSVRVRPHVIARQVLLWTVLGLGFGAIVYVVSPGNTQENNTQHAPISQQQTVPQPSILDQMRQAFGPWQLIDNQDLGDYQSVVLLRQNGTKELGSKHLQPGSDWQSTVAIDFQDVEFRENYALVRTASGVIYRLAVQQPFVVEARPETVYAFTASGTVVAAPTVTILKEQ